MPITHVISTEKIVELPLPEAVASMFLAAQWVHGSQVSPVARATGLREAEPGGPLGGSECCFHNIQRALNTLLGTEFSPESEHGLNCLMTSSTHGDIRESLFSEES